MKYFFPKGEANPAKRSDIKLKIRNALLGRKRTKEQRERMSKSHIGKPQLKLRGVPKTEEHKKKLSEVAKKRFAIPQNNPNWKGGKPRCLCGKEIGWTSKRCSSCWKSYNVGKNHFAWDGGKTPLNFQIRNSQKYRQWRADVFTRDNFVCVWCGYSRGGILEADHILPLSLLIREHEIRTFEQSLLCEPIWNINNGRTLCRDCHKKTNTYGNKKYKI